MRCKNTRRWHGFHALHTCFPCNYFCKSQKSIFQQFGRFVCTVSSRISECDQFLRHTTQLLIASLDLWSSEWEVYGIYGCALRYLSYFDSVHSTLSEYYPQSIKTLLWSVRSIFYIILRLPKGGSQLPAPFLFLSVLPAPFLRFPLLPAPFCYFTAPCSLMRFHLPAPFLISLILLAPFLNLLILPAPWLPLWESLYWMIPNPLLKIHLSKVMPAFFEDLLYIAPSQFLSVHLFVLVTDYTLGKF